MNRESEIANIWYRQKWIGFPVSIMVAKRFGVTERHARRLIMEVRALGLIPPVPQNDKRRTK